jgi:hypothetical protein
MRLDKPVRKMTLRELLTYSEKCNRDLVERIQNDILPQVDEYRDLNRPIRRRSHYPTLLALQNALARLEESSAEMQALGESLTEQLEIIRDNARREVGMRI